MKLAMRVKIGPEVAGAGGPMELIDADTGEVLGIVQQMHQQFGLDRSFEEDGRVKLAPNGEHQVDLLVSFKQLTTPRVSEQPLLSFEGEGEAPVEVVQVWGLDKPDGWMPPWARSIVAVSTNPVPFKNGYRFGANAYGFESPRAESPNVRDYLFDVDASFVAPWAPTEGMRAQLLSRVTDLLTQGVRLDDAHWLHAVTVNLCSRDSGNELHVCGSGQMVTCGFDKDKAVEQITLKYGALDVSKDGILVEIVPGTINIILRETPERPPWQTFVSNQPTPEERTSAKERLEAWCGNEPLVLTGIRGFEIDQNLMERAMAFYPRQEDVLKALFEYVKVGSLSPSTRDTLNALVKNASKEETP